MITVITSCSGVIHFLQINHTLKSSYWLLHFELWFRKSGLTCIPFVQIIVYHIGILVSFIFYWSYMLYPHILKYLTRRVTEIILNFSNLFFLLRWAIINYIAHVQNKLHEYIVRLFNLKYFRGYSFPLLRTKFCCAKLYHIVRIDYRLKTLVCFDLFTSRAYLVYLC